MKKNLKILIFILITLFLLITLLVITNNTTNFDFFVYRLIISFRCNILDKYFKFITTFGNTNMIIIILGLFILIFRDKRSITLTIATFSCVIVNSIIKHIIKRHRPTVLHLIKQGGYSFPSGHSMIAVCLYGYLLYLVNKNVKNKLIKTILNLFLIVFILSIGLSRIYVGVHFASDVIAGYLLSSILLLLVINYTNKYLI